MKNLLTLAACALLMVQAIGQAPASEKLRPATMDDHNQQSPEIPVQGVGTRNVVFQEDFANGLTGNNGFGPWTVSGSHGSMWRRKTTGPLGAFTPTSERIQSTTVSNGYMLFNSDSVNCTWNGNSPTQLPEAQFIDPEGSLESPLLDLSATPFVQLRFQQRVRYCCGSAPHLVEVSHDGGFSWPFQVFVTEEVPANTLSGTLTHTVNLSAAIAPDPSNVKFRFRHTSDASTSHYHWQIDDVVLVEQPQYDLKLLYGYISNVNNGNEYGRIPATQLVDGSMVTGGGFINFGSHAHENVVLETAVSHGGDQVILSHIEYDEISFADTVDAMEIAQMLNPVPGTYDVSFRVSSDQEQEGDEHWPNNTVPDRRFHLTDHLYALDNVGGHAPGQQVLSGMGTNTFENNADGIMLMTQYVITSPITITAVEVGLANGTFPSGQIHVAIYDSASIFPGYPDDLTPNLAIPLGYSNIAHTVTSQNISAQKAVVLLATPTLLQPGIYYASAELDGSEQGQQIRVLDDETIPQPSWSSLVYLPNATDPNSTPNRIWTNGNALAVRLVSDPSISVEEHGRSAHFALYPNPVVDVTTISFELMQAGRVTTEVKDASGRIVASTEHGHLPIGSHRLATILDVLATGVYSLALHTPDGTGVVRMIKANK